MHISLHGFVAGPNREMNWIKVDEVPKGCSEGVLRTFGKIFDHVGKRISKGDTVPMAGCSFSLPISIGTGEVLRYKCICKLGMDK